MTEQAREIPKYSPSGSGSQAAAGPPIYGQYTSHTSPVEEPQIPREVTLAVYCMYPVAAVSFMISAMLLPFFDEVNARVAHYLGFWHLPLSYNPPFYLFILASVFLFNIALCWAYIRFAISAKKGWRRGRMRMTLAFCLNVLGLLTSLILFMSGYGLPLFLNAVSSLFALAGIVLVWLPPAEEYYHNMAVYRLNQPDGLYPG